MRGSPQVRDTAAWAPRLAQGKDKLYQHVIDGLGWMPRRGTCFTCSDEEVKAAVDYMLTLVPPG
jgi:cytochrome c5